jgi:hypothetical protein
MRGRTPRVSKKFSLTTCALSVRVTPPVRYVSVPICIAARPSGVSRATQVLIIREREARLNPDEPIRRSRSHRIVEEHMPDDRVDAKIETGADGDRKHRGRQVQRAFDEHADGVTHVTADSGREHFHAEPLEPWRDRHSESARPHGSHCRSTRLGVGA